MAEAHERRRMMRWLAAILAVAVLAATGWAMFGDGLSGAGNSEEGGKPAATGGSPRGGGIPVEARAVTVDTVRVEVSAVGSLRANESVIVRPEISGRVTEIAFQEGDDVGEGDVLVRLDDSVLRARLAEAEASLVLSRTNYQRAQQLYERKTASAVVRDEALAKLREDEASVALARAELDKTRILAPFDGTVGLRVVSVGDYVSAGKDIVDFVDDDPIKVDFSVPEGYAARVEVGQPVSIVVDALPGQTFEGEVYALSPVIDVNGRSMQLRAIVPNADGALRPGMFARVRLMLAQRDEAILVPEEAVVPVGREQFVFRVVEGKVARTAVELGERGGGLVEVQEGLSPGDIVVTAGQIKLQDGAPVTVLGAKPES